jgi:translation initiation factor 1A
MPPNKKGGKNYKKGKHATEEPVVYERQPDQMYGRVLKLLGGCNALVYCNDGRERLCHIRGSMRKKVWIATGDIVLISTRELSQNAEDTVGTAERGDICAKYDQKVIYKLRQKDPTISDKLFTFMAKADGTGNVPVDNEEGFIFESDGENNKDMNENEDESESESDSEFNNGCWKSINRTAQKKTMIHNDDDDSDINIDEI